MTTIRIDFGYRNTPRGCTAWELHGRHHRFRRFHNMDEATGQSRARRWVDLRIVELRRCNNMRVPSSINYTGPGHVQVYVNDQLRVEWDVT